MKQYRDKKLLKAIASVAATLRKEKKKGLTQEEVMNDLKINYSITIHIGRIETAVTNLSVSQLRLLCNYYNISLTDFFKKVEDRLSE